MQVTPAQVDTTAALTIDGTVKDAAAPGDQGEQRVGVYVDGEGTAISASNGARVNIAGHDLMNDANLSSAVIIESGATMSFSSAGPLTIQGGTRVRLSARVEVPNSEVTTLSAGDIFTFDGSISGDPTALTFNARDISFSGANINIGFGTS